MTYPSNARRTVVIKASRDTLVLVSCAVAVTFALSYAVHTRPVSVAASEVGTPPQQEWAGSLSDVAVASKPVQPTETMTSASLVVPSATLSLPKEPSRVAVQKPRVCDQGPCPLKASSTPLPPPPVRQKPVVAETVNIRTGGKETPSLVGRLNPFNHLPDAVRHSFDYAGNTVSGWINRL